MIIKYKIEKHKHLGNKINGNYVVWRESQGKHSYSCKGVFQGSRQECLQYLKELKEK